MLEIIVETINGNKNIMWGGKWRKIESARTTCFYEFGSSSTIQSTMLHRAFYYLNLYKTECNDHISTQFQFMSLFIRDRKLYRRSWPIGWTMRQKKMEFIISVGLLSVRNSIYFCQVTPMSRKRRTSFRELIHTNMTWNCVKYHSLYTIIWKLKQMSNLFFNYEGYLI